MAHLRIDDIKEFSPAEDIRKKLFGSDRLIAEIVCYEPGQHTVQHLHPRQDELFYIVEGRGMIVVDDEEIPVAPTSVVFIPAKTKHGIKSIEDSRLVLMFVKGPGTAPPAPK